MTATLTSSRVALTDAALGGADIRGPYAAAGTNTPDARQTIQANENVLTLTNASGTAQGIYGS